VGNFRRIVLWTMSRSLPFFVLLITGSPSIGVTLTVA
jgi:hypothetical protein